MLFTTVQSQIWPKWGVQAKISPAPPLASQKCQLRKLICKNYHLLGGSSRLLVFGAALRSPKNQNGQKNSQIRVIWGLRRPHQALLLFRELNVKLLLFRDPTVVLLLLLTITTVFRVNVWRLYHSRRLRAERQSATPDNAARTGYTTAAAWDMRVHSAASPQRGPARRKGV